MPAGRALTPPRFGDAQLSLFDEAPAAQPRALTPAAAAPPPTPSPLAPAPRGPMPSSGTEPAAAPASPDGPRFRHPKASREIALGPHRIAYELRRARRRTIGFVVGLEGLSVSAPRWVGVGDIEAALREKGAWILRKLQEQHERSRRVQAAKVEWREGASLPFLGEPVILVLDSRLAGAQLRTAPEALPGLPSRTLHLGLPQSASAEQIRDTVQSWLQREARQLFEQRCAVFAERLGVRVRRLSLSSASTRWGSASADGSVRLNWRLIHFGLPIIDYVVAHELAHLREMNHSPAFWDVVRQALPDYEHAQGALKRSVVPDLG